MKVYLSPSSQTANIGYGGYGTEADRMQQLSDKVKDKLADLGHTVYGSDNSLDLNERIAASNKEDVDCHVALHSNASSNGTARGAETYYYSTSNNGKRLAQSVLDQIVAVDGCYKSRGIKATTTLAECRKTSAPATLVEVAFHDNKDDAAWIMEKIDDIAAAIANGINAYV